MGGKQDLDYDEDDEIQDKPFSGPLKVIMALFLITLLVAVYIPLNAIRVDPEPANVPGWEVIPKDIEIIDEHITSSSKRDILLLVKPYDPVVKQLADTIVGESCGSHKVCQAKVLFYFVRDNFNYVSDPTRYEYVKSARESLVTRAGDCDDAAVLLSNLMGSIGIEARFVFVPGHVYVQVYLPEALKKYKEEDHWVSLDPTCKNCKFGEIPYSSVRAEDLFGIGWMQSILCILIFLIVSVTLLDGRVAVQIVGL